MSDAAFQRYIGIDYSGAQTPDSSLKGLRVYEAGAGAAPVEVPPPPGARKYWTRRGIAEWLVERLADKVPSLVGIDHGFSFPMRYFEVHQLPPDWPAFLDDFQRHWPTDGDHVYVDFVRDGALGHGEARMGSARWRRLAEQRVGAKSVFHFDVRGRWPNPPTPGCPGCAICAMPSVTGCIAGHSTAGKSPPDGPHWPRSIHRSGAKAPHGRTARRTSTMPTSPPPGSSKWIGMAAWASTSSRSCGPANTPRRKSRAGF